MTSDPKFCAAVAEKVLGWQRANKGGWFIHPPVRRRIVHFYPDTNANDDLLALHEVRRWASTIELLPRFPAFYLALNAVWQERSIGLVGERSDDKIAAVFYEVGDYSRAALAALKGATP